MKKNIAKVLFLLALCFSVLIFVSCNKEESNDTRLAVENGLPVVDRYGQLQVIGTNLCNQDGQPVQLRGMSSHGLHWYGKFANKNVLQWLRDDWNTQVWRAAMYLAQGGYVTSRACKLRMIDSIEAALELGMYVIVDWHVHGDRDPLLYKDQAIEFFTEIAQKYGDNPHIIYEICNEPNGDDVTWKDNIKPYAEEVIATIRQYDPDNIIIVGTSTWSQDVDVAAKDPIDAENIMYTMHFYAGTHGRELKAKARRALRKGLPIFVTEWGTTQATGTDGVFEKETLKWISFLEKNNISWVNWSVNNKGEDSGILIYNADRNAKGGWTDKDLTPSGKLVRSILRNEAEIK